MTLLTVSALEAACELCNHLQAYQDVGIDHAVEQLRRGPSSVARLDFERGRKLIEGCGMAAFEGSASVANRRRIVARVVEVERPTWRLAAVRGRKWSRDAMSPDSEQALDWAQLWSNDDEAVDWWHSMAAAARSSSDIRRSTIGREGERLTLEYEQRRLADVGAGQQPVWRSLEDDTLGYDIDSWELTESGDLLPLRIEVKAYSGTDRRFFLSRREWETAKRFAKAFLFYLWDITTQSLTRLSVIEVSQAIPEDRRGGEWQEILLRPSEFPAQFR